MSSLPQPPTKSWYKRWWIWLLIIVVLLAVAGVIVQQVRSSISSSSTTAEQTVIAERRDLAKTIVTTGKIAPEHSEALSFSFGGSIKELNVAVGDEVSKDDVLAKTSNQSLKAPFDGRVISVSTFVGSTATPGIPVMEIGYRTNFIDFIASESEVFDITTGQTAELTIPTYNTGSTVYHGTVETVSSKKVMLSATENGYLVRIRPTDLPDTVNNRIDLTVNVKVLIAEKTNVLSVERAAIQYDSVDRPFVWTPNSVTPTEPIVQNIVTDFEGDDYIEITSGIKAGDTILLNIPKASTNSIF
ncbi:MAG: HlyD family efflux transporter periplasmic adaptor subunit [Patescibacteria group bacterium]|jgi:multidrug efflux pump subunit AcrA (membrane-fusion protein)